MKPRIATLLLLLLGTRVLAQDHDVAPVKRTELHLRAKIDAVVPLTEFSGKATPVDLAPRFALTLRIETVKPGLDDWVPGAQITFAIHSPTLLFAGNPEKNLVYDFYLVREIEDGKVRFHGLSTHPPCAENDVVGYPLSGWVGYTNTGESVSDMTVTARTRQEGPPLATAMTDSTGKFSFTTLGLGKFYLKATKKLVETKIDAEAVVTVTRGKHFIACLVAEAAAKNTSRK